ncbi:hypothetical protein [Desulfoscipio gibsoniae]
MYKFGDLILCLGVFLFFLGGVALAFGVLTANSPLLPVIAAFSLILIAIGGFIKKRNA